METGLAASGAEAIGNEQASKTKAGATKPAPKNIVLCSDGTGNQGGKGHGTNVWRLYNYLDLGEPAGGEAMQVAFYNDGVGSQDWKIFKLIGGAFGWGLSRNICDLYSFLARNYVPGDRIYLFGFSRGAYTVRILADLITSCGVFSAGALPDPKKHREAIDIVYQQYRKRYGSCLNHLRNWMKKNEKDYAYLKETSFHEKVPVHFLGVWDTVDAVGIPGLRDIVDSIFYYRFDNRRLSHKVGYARHAVAIDDERGTFHPVMWDEKGSSTGQSDDPDISQVWFSGAHCNVGGGYPKQGMSNVALHWMMSEAKQKRKDKDGNDADGLRFLDTALGDVANQSDVNDKLYNSRAGLAAYYRYRPRDIAALCEENCTSGKAKIHPSVLTRLARATDD